ncbi:MAG: hypothetical protein IJ791_07115 [Lachnospiraceae bacterium]|nr:hypothetical protein [Lachnospiraceae bacterium]
MEKEKNNPRMICAGCGAPITSEKCPYCGRLTGLDTEEADLEYPELEAHSAKLDFWGVGFPAIFGGSFGVATIGCLLAIIFTHEWFVLIHVVVFGCISIVSLAILIRNATRYMQVKRLGKDITGTIYGYVDADYTINDRPGQLVKILIDTPYGKRFIFYDTKKTTHPFGINTTVSIKRYKDLFIVQHTM